jgi:hypothetical protein
VRERGKQDDDDDDEQTNNNNKKNYNNQTHKLQKNKKEHTHTHTHTPCNGVHLSGVVTTVRVGPQLCVKCAPSLIANNIPAPTLFNLTPFTPRNLDWGKLKQCKEAIKES